MSLGKATCPVCGMQIYNRDNAIPVQRHLIYWMTRHITEEHPEACERPPGVPPMKWTTPKWELEMSEQDEDKYFYDGYRSPHDTRAGPESTLEMPHHTKEGAP